MSSIGATALRSARCLRSGTLIFRKPLSTYLAPSSSGTNSELPVQVVSSREVGRGIRIAPMNTVVFGKGQVEDKSILIEAAEESSGFTQEERQVELAKTLPESLITFFRRFPPSDAYATGPQKPEPPQEGSSAEQILLASTPFSDPTYNPFQTWKNPVTGRWRPPMFSLRRQAELVKKAMAHGVAELLPFTSKLPWVKAQKREEHGLRVKGTGVGQKVKGKAWERTVKGRLEKRRRAMLEMPKLVQQWKERGHGRGWKKWPN